nr:ribonuclease H-like domain, reverse transcriptase, RNA-dependent DNA polymerase [Tanacetum cinerariifolium]
GNPQQELQEKGVIDSGCSRHMTGNMLYLSKYEEIDGGYVAFGGDPKGGKITSKETECVGLSPNFKLLDERQVLLTVPRKNNMYSVDLRNVAPLGGLKDEVADDAGKKSIADLRKENGVRDPTKEGSERAQRNEFESMFGQENDDNRTRVFTPVSATGSTCVYLDGSMPINVATLLNADLPTDPLMPDLEDTADTGIFSDAYDDEVEGADADFNNLKLTTVVSPILTTRIHKDHPKEKIIGDPLSTLQTKRMTKTSQEHDMMDVKSAFLYGITEEEVYVSQPSGFEDPYFPNKVYQVEKALYGLHQARRAWYETLSTYLLENSFRRGIIDKTLFIKKDKDDILLVQVSMIGSLMYVTASRPDIMFAICARFQVTPKISHLHAVKRIFRYLKGQPKLDLWYPRDSPFYLEAFSDSDYAGASLDRKSTIGGCQFLGKRLISWQCKKQTIVANSTTRAKYVVAASCCG